MGWDLSLTLILFLLLPPLLWCLLVFETVSNFTGPPLLSAHPNKDGIHLNYHGTRKLAHNLEIKLKVKHNNRPPERGLYSLPGKLLNDELVQSLLPTNNIMFSNLVSFGKLSSSLVMSLALPPRTHNGFISSW
jgi:hypothetical protein